jgi:hypothetical protein
MIKSRAFGGGELGDSIFTAGDKSGEGALIVEPGL